ncbi:uncharacterized protein LOC108670402 [Hyalella azteca]|uniref:Uncharacterized protein LOC108670402 n=1 Tax=Hyalella azteca TaxID=294128 RepID=A0A8B7NI91_HYAAZ|nr:uncharacterized protein LOC108670402 [Hyalella azteca]
MASRWLRTKTVPQLFRQACNEIPEVMGAGVFGLLGAVTLTYLIIRDYNKPGRNCKKYKMEFVVYRPESPYVQYLNLYDTPESLQDYQEDLKPYLKSRWNRA